MEKKKDERPVFSNRQQVPVTNAVCISFQTVYRDLFYFNKLSLNEIIHHGTFMPLTNTKQVINEQKMIQSFFK